MRPMELGATPAGQSVEEKEKRLVWFKWLMFFGALNGASWGRFGAIYYVHKGLSATQIGSIEFGMIIVSALVNPFWGFLGDHYFSKKRVFLFNQVVRSCVLLTLMLANGYGAILAISLAMSFFTAQGVVRAAILGIAGDHAKVLFGRVRLWGAVGWGVGALAMGFITDAVGSFLPNFFIFFGTAIISVVLTAAFIPDDGGSRGAPASGGGEAAQKRHSTREFIAVLCKLPVMLFLFETCIVGAGVGVVERLLFVYMRNDLGASVSLCGLSVGVTVVFEIPLFYYAGPLMEKIGRNGCLAIAYFCYVVRVFGYTVLTPSTVWYILPLESLHGITFAFAFMCFVETSRVMTPKGWEATVQSLLNTAYLGFGSGGGALLGGWIMDAFGARTMYRGAGSGVALFFLLRLGLSIREKLNGGDFGNKDGYQYSRVPTDASADDDVETFSASEITGEDNDFDDSDGEEGDFVGGGGGGM